MSIADSSAVEAALLGVPGIAAAELSGEDLVAGASTLRLQLSAGADEVAVATAVNRLLREQFGLAVDAERVHLLEAPQPPGREPAPSEREPLPSRTGSGREALMLTVAPRSNAPRDPVRAAVSIPPATLEPADHEPAVGPRLAIERVRMATHGLGGTSEVWLRRDGHSYLGEAEGAATANGWSRSVAAATVRAVEGVTGGRARFVVDLVDVTTIGSDRTVLSVITMVTLSGSERLTGVSLVRGDVRQAVIRATLAALNRRVEPLLQA